MIYGIGTDVVEVSRIKLALKKYGLKLAEKILTHNELHDSLGKPLIKYHNKLQALVEEKFIHHCHLSISDEKNIAVAFVILEL